LRSIGSCSRLAAAGLALLLWTALLVLPAPAAQALVPERRRDFEERRPNEYLLVPAIASLPGIGVFAGLIGAGTNLGDTGINVAATLAESIDDSDIELQAVALQEVPLAPSALTFDYQVAHIKLGNLETYLPGRDSPNFTIPVTGEFDFQLVRPSLRLSERRFNLWYTLSFFHGFDFDQTGNEVPLSRHGASAGMLLDLTDDVVDPRLGVRFGYQTSLPPPSSSLLGKDSGDEGAFGTRDDLRVRDYTLTFYVPLVRQLYLAWANAYFEATGREESEEVITGGSPPLRGYPAGRWSDRFGVFSGLELRYNLPLFKKLEFLLVSGILEEVQLAAFYEAGQVSPVKDHTLYEELHRSYGAGVRALFQAIVLRMDLAFSDEGMQTHLTIGQAF
jgi:hypothetical protein